MENIAVAVIGLLGSVIVALISYRGVVAAGKTNLDAMLHQLEMHQAVTDEKISNLTKEVREHNEFARRMPVLEEKISVANHRIEDLEEEAKK